jgi:hypothetical protein
MAILKIKTETEFYLFMNGKLIYKRWLETGQSIVFDVMPYTKKTFVSLKSKIPK